MSGVARGVEGASEYAVDERGNPFWTYSSPAGPLEITINNWYCMLLAVAGILAIILGLPRIKARSTEA